jgi:hypothetical protein
MVATCSTANARLWLNSENFPASIRGPIRPRRKRMNGDETPQSFISICPHSPPSPDCLLRRHHIFLPKVRSHGPWYHLLYFPTSPVLLLSSRPRVCCHNVLSWVFTLRYIIYHFLVRSCQYVFLFPIPEGLVLNHCKLQGAHALTSNERGAFIGGAIMEMLFFFISAIGYVAGTSRSKY